MSKVLADERDVKPVHARRRRESPYDPIDLRDRGIWPAATPTMTRDEALVAGKMLWRKFAGRQWPGTWRPGRGNHRIYARGTVMLANPGLGWPRFVHDLSHTLYRYMTSVQDSDRGPHLYVNGERRPILSKAVFENYRTARAKHHTGAHAKLEKAMILTVIESGWLDGTLRVGLNKMASSRRKQEKIEFRL